VSLDRVSKFLSEEETPKYKLSKLARNTHEGAIYGGDKRASFAEVVSATDIGFVNASFSWKSAASTVSTVTTAVASTENLGKAYSETDPLLSAESGQNTATRPSSSNNDHSHVFELQDLTISFPVGKLSIIAGPTGCGKTSLLMALLGEMRLIAGQVMIPGALFRSRADMPGEDVSDVFAPKEAVAYVAQQAWLLNDTIRGNIIFGLPYDEQRYREVVRMCALARDFEILEAGDMTEVGERGVALSGGQKQRICLARAVYSPARHVIMDDCLSAVDAHTAKHLYDSCLMSPYMSERTRILVTHAVGLTIKGASTVVVMQDGHIAASGTPMEVLRSGKLSEETLREADEAQQNAATRAETSLDDKGKAADVATSENPDSVDNPDSKTIDKRFDGIVGGSGVNTATTSKDASQKNDSQKGKLTTEEEWSRGHVQWRVYLAYLRASGGLVFWAILTVLFLLTQGLQVAQDWWLREWAASYSRPVLPVEHSVHTSAATGILNSPFVHSAANSSPAALLASGAITSTSSSVSVSGNDSSNSKGVDLAYFIGVYIVIA
ncbi:hypothetical protein LPJ73_006575, partial [Coemansia sp. RSA 2703]